MSSKSSEMSQLHTNRAEGPRQSTLKSLVYGLFPILLTMAIFDVLMKPEKACLVSIGIVGLLLLSATLLMMFVLGRALFSLFEHLGQEALSFVVPKFARAKRSFNNCAGLTSMRRKATEDAEAIVCRYSRSCKLDEIRVVYTEQALTNFATAADRCAITLGCVLIYGLRHYFRYTVLVLAVLDYCYLGRSRKPWPLCTPSLVLKKLKSSKSLQQSSGSLSGSKSASSPVIDLPDPKTLHLPEHAGCSAGQSDAPDAVFPTFRRLDLPD